MTMFKITTCPTCGSRRIRPVRKDVTEEAAGKRYTIPDLEFYECPVCGEKLYDREAMRKLESFSPAARGHGARRRISA